jgi:hypothetical protein
MDVISDVLRALLDAEQALAEQDPGTPDHELAARKVDELSAIYARLTDDPITSDLVRQAKDAIAALEADTRNRT